MPSRDSVSSRGGERERGRGRGSQTLNKHVCCPVPAYVRRAAFPAAVERGVVVCAEAWGDGVEVVEAGGQRGEGGEGGRRGRRRGGVGVGVGVGVGIVDERHWGGCHWGGRGGGGRAESGAGVGEQRRRDEVCLQQTLALALRGLAARGGPRGGRTGQAAAGGKRASERAGDWQRAGGRAGRGGEGGVLRGGEGRDNPSDIA